VLIVACVGAGPVDAEEKWQILTIPESGFSVDMPGTPVRQQDMTDRGLRYVLYTVEEDPARDYVVGMQEIAPDAAAEGAQKLYDDARDSLARSTGGKLRAERPVSCDGVAGREIIIDAEDDTGMNTLIDRVFLKGSRLYQLGAIVPRGTERDAAVTRFLDSARIEGN
jgi:hypothetical protein